jgi:hypothetical protein
MNASQFMKGKINQGPDRLASINPVSKSKPHIIGAPSRERTSQYPQAEFAHDHSGEITDRHPVLLQNRNNRLAFLSV